MSKICERCGNKPADFVALVSINGQRKKLALCEDCLNELMENHGDTPGDSDGEEGAGFFGSFGPGASGTGQKTVRKSDSGLDEFTIDITEQARNDELDPVIGRESELERILQVLGRKKKNNPVLIGEAGVGKTAIVEALAQRITDREVPEHFSDYSVLTLDVAGMLAGTKMRGAFEQRMKSVLDEVVDRDDVILFIDELHTILGAGAAEGALDAANMLKPALARGELQCIGATTLGEYRKYVEKDGALARRFQPVMVDEPSEEETVEILEGLAPVYEEYHGVDLSDEVLECAVRLSDRYINDRFLPDKAIDVVDEASTLAVLRDTEEDTKQVAELRQELERIRDEKERLAAAEEYEEAAELKKKEDELLDELHELGHSDREADRRVTVEDISKVVSTWSGVPVGVLKASEAERIVNLADSLRERVVGQDQAVEAVAAAIKRGKAGLKEVRRPIGSFMFLGPTGVGKTELAKALAAELFGSPDDLITLDMSEYMERHSTSRLMGAPPGYVGYEEAGQLTEAVRRKPYSVVLFDEFEKAHAEVQSVLLQLLEEGRLTDSKGRKVDFSNTVVILTSNLGTSDPEKGQRVGFEQSAEERNEDYRNQIMQTAKEFLRPEFINRLDDMIVFNPIDREALADILELRLGELNERVQSTHDFELQFDDSLREHLIDEGFSTLYGARELRRVIRRNVEDVLADYVLDKGADNLAGKTLHVTRLEGETAVVEEVRAAAETANSAS